MKRAHLFISGKVQGVFFRANTVEKAKELEVNGWVKNLDDGRVEAVFEGDKESVQKMIDWCMVGPDSANVENIDIKWEEPKGLDNFERKN